MFVLLVVAGGADQQVDLAESQCGLIHHVGDGGPVGYVSLRGEVGI